MEIECRKKDDHKAVQPSQSNTATNTTATTAKSAFVCYGCNTPGVMKSQCANCKSTADTSTNDAASADFYEMETVQHSEGIKRLSLNVSIYEMRRIACADTGSIRSIMGRNLYNKLKDKRYLLI